MTSMITDPPKPTHWLLLYIFMSNVAGGPNPGFGKLVSRELPYTTEEIMACSQNRHGFACSAPKDLNSPLHN